MSLLLSLLGSQLDFLASEHALLHDRLIMLDPLLLALSTKIEQVQSVSDQLRLDALIEARVSLEAGRLVHLDEPRFAILINQHIEAQDLEAQLVLQIIWLTRLVQMGQTGLRHNQRLYDNFVDLLLHLLVRFAHALKCVGQRL